MCLRGYLRSQPECCCQGQAEVLTNQIRLNVRLRLIDDVTVHRKALRGWTDRQTSRHVVSELPAQPKVHEQQQTGVCVCDGINDSGGENVAILRVSNMF